MIVILIVLALIGLELLGTALITSPLGDKAWGPIKPIVDRP